MLIIFFGASSQTNAQMPSVSYNICNEGTVPVWVAIVSTHINWFDRIWMLEGWWKIDPEGSWGRCPNVGRYGVTHLAFAVFTDKKEFGVVTYDFDTQSGGNFAVDKICVKNDSMDFTSKTINYSPPCPNGFIAVPTSLSLWYGGGNVSVTLSVRPTPKDYDRISVYLTERKSTATSKLALIFEGQPYNKQTPERFRGKPIKGVTTGPDNLSNPWCGYEWVYPYNPNNIQVRLKKGYYANKNGTASVLKGYRVRAGMICTAEIIPTKRSNKKQKSKV